MFLGLLVLISVVAAESSLATATQFGTKSVLFISSERSDMPAMRELEGTIRGVFHQSIDPEVELFPEYFDFARFPIEQYAATNIQYLRDRYANQQIDLILVTTGFALEFVLSHRDELFPKAPIVFCATADGEIIRPQLPPNVTGVVGHFDIERTLKLIFTLQPNVTEIVFVGGTSTFDRFWEEQTRKVLERFADRTRFRWITDESLNQTAHELSKLPPTSAVFYVSMLRDGEGHSMTATDAVRDLCRVSKAPVYGFTSHFLDAGAVGGAVFDFGVNGRKAAELVLKILRGEWVPAGSPELEIRNPVAINWEALKKWNLSESRVPAGAEMRNMPAGLWETHRTLIVWTVFVVLVQSTLIVGWLAQRLWRRRAELSLHESEQRFQATADAAPVLMWMAGPDKLCTFFNQTWLDFTGRTMEQEFGNGWAEGVHPDDLDNCLNAYSVAFDARKPFLLEYRLRRHDGEYCWLMDRGVPRSDAAGGFLGYIGACVDTTELRKKDEALHEFEQRVTLATDAAHLGVWERDLVNNNFWISDKARELFQFHTAEPVSYRQFRERTHPDDLQLSDLARSRAVETKGGYELEYRVLLPDKTLRWISGRACCVLDENGKVTRLLGVLMDVTDRKRAEEKLAQLSQRNEMILNSAAEGILGLDLKGNHTFANAAAARMLGYEPEELVGHHSHTMWHHTKTDGTPYPIEECNIYAAYRDGKTHTSTTEVFWRKDGTSFPVDYSSRPVFDQDRIVGAVVTFMDISARKQLEEEGRRRREQLELLTRVSLLGEMTGSLAHELNQPLAAIASNANAAMRFIDKGKLEPEKLREILVDIVDDGHRAHEIIHNVRNTIKKGSTLRQKIDLNEVISHVAHLVQPDAWMNSSKLNTSSDKDLPKVEADPVQIQQVLVNLISNAFQAMREVPVNQREVEVTAHRNGAEEICVSVRDHGMGLVNGAEEKIFEQFFTTKADGLGMGLAIVRSIIESHSGKIAAENAVGGGARFSFTLPISN